MGIITIRIAFSCTCQPNMKDVRPHRVMARMNASLRTFLKEIIIVFNLLILAVKIYLSNQS